MEEPEKKKARLIKALDSLIYMPKMKQTRDDLEVPGLALNQEYSLVMSDSDGKRRQVPSIGRPWDRGELYARLQTFKSMTWFAKPEKVDARECARRGWENSGLDELTCETCRAVLKYPAVESVECEKVVGERFEERLVLAHDATCPWRSAVCSLSLLEFPKHLSCMTMVADFRSRCAALQKLLCIPPISKEAVDVILPELSDSKDALYVVKKGVKLEGSRREWAESLEFSDDALIAMRMSLKTSIAPSVERCDFMARVHMIALCGWSLKILSLDESHEEGDVGYCLPEHAALQCTLCGAKVGLWSFFEGCAPKSFSAASLVQKSGPVYKTGKSSFILNHQVAMNMTTTIAGGMLHQMDDLLMQDVDGPFGRPGPDHVQPFTSPGGGKKTPSKESTVEQEAKPAKSKATRRRSQTIAQYKTACIGSLDPLSLHRSFCPWANVPTPAEGGDEENSAGWKVYVDNLASGPADLLTGTKEWQGKDMFRKVMSSVGKLAKND